MKLTYDDIEKMIGLVKVNYAFAYKDFKTTDFEILIESWYEDLSKYEREFVITAFKRARRICKFPPTPADIIEQIEKILAAFGESDAELWQKLLENRTQCIKHINRISYGGIDDNGKTRIENVQAEIEDLFNNMLPDLKSYCVNKIGFIDFCMLNDDSLEFEKTRFFKRISNIQEIAAIRSEAPQLEALARSEGMLIKTMKDNCENKFLNIAK